MLELLKLESYPYKNNLGKLGFGFEAFDKPAAKFQSSLFVTQ